jgi:glycerol-3-phosphate acyltransferase PlsY
MVLREILALIIAYLLGSIPTAYIVTRIVKGQDIRRLGGGNIGSLNTLKSVGRLPGTIVGLVDVSKGAAAVLIAFYGLGVPPLFVMLAGLLSVVGHMWMIFLKFTGGRGMGPTVGSVVTVLCVYADWLGLGIFLFLIAVPIFITRNVPISMIVGLFGLPFITWFTTFSATGTVMTVILGLLTGGKFLPTGMKELRAWRGRRKAAATVKNTDREKDRAG